MIISLDTGKLSPMMHCQIAFGSLSRGSRSTPFALALDVTTSPAITTVSLLARAMVLPASMAASVGPMATSPIVAVTTMSTSGSHTISSRSRSTHPSASIGAFSDSVPLQWMYLG